MNYLSIAETENNCHQKSLQRKQKSGLNLETIYIIMKQSENIICQGSMLIQIINTLRHPKIKLITL